MMSRRISEKLAGTFFVTFFALLLLSLSACSLNRITADRTAAMMGEASRAFNEEPDLEFARAAMPGNLKMIEGVLKSSPGNRDALVTLAQGYCSYAFAFLEDSPRREDVARASALYLRGYGFGVRALGDKVREHSAGELEKFENAVNDGDDAAALFWTGYCLGNWVNLNRSDVAAVAELSRAELFMRRVLELDPLYYNGGPRMFYGVYYGSRPRMLGGSTNKAKEHFEKAIKASDGKFLVARLMYAQFYAVPVQDEALFETTLSGIVNAPEGLLPGEAFANAVAKKRAAALLARKKDLF